MTDKEKKEVRATVSREAGDTYRVALTGGRFYNPEKGWVDYENWSGWTLPRLRSELQYRFGMRWNSKRITYL